MTRANCAGYFSTARREMMKKLRARIENHRKI